MGGGRRVRLAGCGDVSERLEEEWLVDSSSGGVGASFESISFALASGDADCLGLRCWGTGRRAQAVRVGYLISSL